MKMAAVSTVGGKNFTASFLQEVFLLPGDAPGHGHTGTQAVTDALETPYHVEFQTQRGATPQYTDADTSQ